MKIPIDTLILDAGVQLREGLNAEAVERYALILDKLPPVLVVRGADGDVLADGFHRIEAAQSRKRTTIDAEIRSGTRADAMTLAVTSNAAHGVPFKRAERDAAVLRLADAGQEQAAIAAVLGITQQRVSEIVRREPLILETSIKSSLAEAALRAPDEYRVPVAKAAVSGTWREKEVREVAKLLADPKVDEDVKREVMRPYISTDPQNGKPALSGALVAETLKQGRRFSALPQVYALTGAAHAVLDHLTRDEHPFDDVSGSDLRRIAEGLDAVRLAASKLDALIEQKGVLA